MSHAFSGGGNKINIQEGCCNWAVETRQCVLEQPLYELARINLTVLSDVGTHLIQRTAIIALREMDRPSPYVLLVHFGVFGNAFECVKRKQLSVCKFRRNAQLRRASAPVAAAFNDAALPSCRQFHKRMDESKDLCLKMLARNVAGDLMEPANDVEPDRVGNLQIVRKEK